MALGIMLIILLVAALIGGYANYLLPANSSEDGKTKLRTVWNCIVLGFTATIMVPLFLELAQSKLLEEVRFSFAWEPSPDLAKTEPTTVKTDTAIATKRAAVDSTKPSKPVSDTVIHQLKTGPSPGVKPEMPTEGLGKNYLLWAAYCFLAAAAGFRFIDMLINNVVKQGEIKNLKSENKELTQDKEREAIQNRVNAEVAEKKAMDELIKTNASRMVGTSEAAKKMLLPSIGPITHLDDPQKGRFGGNAENNFRRLRASVKASYVPEFYNVVIWVESTDATAHPLTENVIFYIHDSFRPNVYTIAPVNGVARDDEILSYGAFTVGAVADHGETLLELDLAEDPSFPKKFRES